MRVTYVIQMKLASIHYFTVVTFKVATSPSSTVVPPTAAVWSTTQTAFIWRRSLSRASSLDCYCRTASQLLCSACVERITFSCHLCGQSRLVQGAAEDTPVWHCLTLNIESPCPWFWFYFIETGTLIFRINWLIAWLSCSKSADKEDVSFT